MKNKFIISLIISSIIIEIVCLLTIFSKIKLNDQNTLKINECIKTIENNYNNKKLYCDSLEYTIINNDEVFYKTANSKINSINDAILNNSIILDLEVDNNIVGKILIDSNINLELSKYRNKIMLFIIFFSIIQIILIIIYYLYINKTIIKPFKKLDDFALRVAGGNLDIPLQMDRGHIFGSFTESFDLMRSELKKARINEKKANDAKKEMIAKLSHDIKTPVASIKATSEIGYEKAKDSDVKNYFNQINIKTDQIKLLVDNLFNSSINEITEISVNPSNYDSSILNELIINSDYLNKLNKYDVPKCNIYIDKLRMQQTIDNIINNSYKYANTKIDINLLKEKDFLKISFRDYGKGVDDMDLPLLKEKYKRGKNVSDEDGAGLGLYLANYFMENMNGKLEIYNSNPGLQVIIYIRII